MRGALCPSHSASIPLLPFANILLPVVGDRYNRTMQPNTNAPSEILVVEDDVLLRMALAMELRSAGFNVAEARDGDEAITLLRSGKTYGLVIADTDLPGEIDGAALDTWLRKEKPDVKIIIVSRYATTRRGSDDFAKPFNLRRLVLDAKQLLGQS